jgi:hypothetical protein
MDHPETHRRKFISGRKDKGKWEEKNQKEVYPQYGHQFFYRTYQ